MKSIFENLAQGLLCYTEKTREIKMATTYYAR